MNAKTAAMFIRLHRSDCRGAEDARIVKAVRFAEGDETLRGALERQRAFDRDARAAIRAVVLPEPVRRRLDAMQSRPAGKRHGWRATLRQPAFLAVVLAVAVLGWLLFREAMSRMENFPGRDSVERMLEINDGLTGSDFEPLATTAGELGDWFALRELERFEVPAEFADFKVVAARLFKLDGYPVAQIAIQKDADNQMLFYVFRAESFGVKLEENHWRRFAESEWIVAARAYGPNVFLVAFKGDDNDMERFLASTKPRK